MVSFQCNECGDVCTKPKLDKHRGQCQSSFDCIDCGKRFDTPSDYKGHTTCISEAEKYEKTLYKGGKPNGNGGRNNNNNQRSWRNGGGYQGGGNNGYHVPNRATGANDTPLGTPIRMSPITETPLQLNPTAPVTQHHGTTTNANKPQVPELQSRKRKHPSNEAPEVATDADAGRLKKAKTASDLDSSKGKESKKHTKKDKKAVEPSSINLLPSPANPAPEPVSNTESDKKNKEKKSKSKHETKERKTSNESKKSSTNEALEAVGTSEPLEDSSKSKKRKKESVVEGAEIVGQHLPSQKRRWKKSRGHDDVDQKDPDTNTTTTSDPYDEQVEKKKPRKDAKKSSKKGES